MCDFSLEHYVSRKAEKGDRLVLHRFPSTTTGLCRAGEHECPTCLQPGTELAFDRPIALCDGVELEHSVAKFVRLERPSYAHRDGVETPDGQQYLLQDLARDQVLRVLQVPAPEPEFKPEAVVLPGEGKIIMAEFNKWAVPLTARALTHARR